MWHLLLLLLLSGARAEVAEVKMGVEEETGKMATVGNVWQQLGRTGAPPKYLVRPQNEFFDVDSDSNVKIRSRIDRENRMMCQRASETSACVVRFSVFDGSSRLVVLVTVKDINDNSPVFKESHKFLSIEEGDTNFRHPLDLASDADVGDNARIRYRLRDSAEAFELETNEFGFDNDFLYLRLKAGINIDYEKERQYNLTLEACDRGKQPRCTDQLLTVQVKDRNDNEPNITQVLTKKVREDLNIGGPVATVVAHDADSGDNARLSFDITDPAMALQFAIDNSGRMTLKKRLNAKQMSRYSVPVRVSDGGSTQRYRDTKVTFKVLDINDHEPIITVVSMTSGAPKIAVAENSQNQSLALLEVRDGDLGDNGRTQCQVETRGFELLASGSDYMLKLKEPFDFEETPVTSARIDCHDFGSPARKSNSKLVSVNFLNVNEFAPSFVGDSFYASVRENGTAGRIVMRLTVSDRDRDEKFTFSLGTSPKASHFRVENDPPTFTPGFGTSGSVQLVLRQPIDRESLDNDLLKFTIFVVDSPDLSSRRHTASVTVTVSVVDINDNPPVVLPPNAFRITEKCALGTRAKARPNGVSQLSSADADQGVNADVSFKLLEVAGVRRGPDGTSESVKLSRQNWTLTVTSDGEIHSVGQIDREQYHQYSLTVKAWNPGASPPLSSTTVVTVSVEDQNDNSPVWVFPNDSDFVINITESHRVREAVTQVLAHDPDELSNVTYSLIGGSDTFAVDHRSGQVRITRKPKPRRYELSIRADDCFHCVSNQLNHPVYTRLVINVFRHARSYDHLRDATVNFTIIVAMIIVTGVISVGLVFAIVCVRRRSQNFSAIDKDACHCHCSLPDMEAPEPMYSHLCTHPPKADRQFAMTTFSHNGSAFDLRPQQPEQQMRNEVVVNQQDLDGDSADSGRGGSEDDHGGHVLSRQLLACSSSATLPRRVMSPPPSSQKSMTSAASAAASGCHCHGIPEEDFGVCGDCKIGRIGLHVPVESPIATDGNPSFLPPPVPPHGVEYRGGSLVRFHPSRHQSPAFHTLTVRPPAYNECRKLNEEEQEDRLA